MEKNVLKDFQTFDEFPEKYLLIDDKSNVFYVKVQDECFITRRRINYVSSIGTDCDILKYKNSYYNILNGECVVKLSFLKSLKEDNDFVLAAEGEIKILPLSDILNLKNNKKYYLNREDIELLVNFEKENNVYKKSLR